MMDSDQERRASIHTFYQVYRPLQKGRDIRSHMHFDVYGENLIEVWEYVGGTKERCICRVREDDEVTCYKRAIEILMIYNKKGEREGYGQKVEQRAG